MTRISKAALVEHVIRRTGGRIDPADVERVLDVALEELANALKDGAVIDLPGHPTASAQPNRSVGSKVEQHLKTEPLAERLGISADTLRRAAQRGDIRPIRLGRDLIWPESEVRRWLDAQRQPETRTS